MQYLYYIKEATLENISNSTSKNVPEIVITQAKDYEARLPEKQNSELSRSHQVQTRAST